MSYFDNAKEIEMKIGKALADEDLVYTLHTKSYPATLIISQSQSPAAQLTFMAEAADGGVSSKDSALRFIFELDGIKIHTDNRLIITDAFMTKLKSLAKKWHTAYTHAFFADKIGQQGNSDDTEQTQDDAETENDTPENGNDAPDFEDDAQDFPVDEAVDAIVESLDVTEETGDDFPVDDADSDPFDDLLDEAEDAVSEDE